MKNQFKTLKELHLFLIANKSELISFKKANHKHTEGFGGTNEQGEVVKSLSTSYKDDLTTGVIKRTVIGNTYNWMDSQSDVLCDNCFAKSLTERQDKIWHLHDHLHQVGAKVGKPTSIYEKSVSWKDLGIDKAGNTQALFMDSNIIKDYNPLIFTQYLNKEITQHSVGMEYVNIDLAIGDPEMKQEFAVWTKYVEAIGNKEAVKEQGYFWAIKEGKLHEISAVLMGSNELTPTLDNKVAELLSSDSVNKNKIQNKDFYANIVKHLKNNPL